MENFNELGLSEPILKAIAEMGFVKPSAIQQKAIPILNYEDGDFIGLAQTGTGKTAAFGLPLIQKIDPEFKKTQVLVIAPTRELGHQISDQLIKYAKYMPKIGIQVVYGGTNISMQMRDLKRNVPHILIATPGRLIDLIDRKAVSIANVACVVLDEADEMLNMGFKEDIDKILSYTPDEKMTWLFSATMPKEIKRIVNTYMTDASEVIIDSKQMTNKNIEHQFVEMKGHAKMENLMRFIDMYDNMRGIIFCRTRRGTQKMAETLMHNGYKTGAIHGDLSQNQRDHVMAQFKNHNLELLVATDVAARGIDVDNITHVIHYDLPDDLPYYTHRSGRTARAGNKGISLSMITRGELRKIKMFEKSLKIKFNEVQAPTFEDVAKTKLNRWAEKLASSSVNSRIDEDLMMSVASYFENFTKEELIERLVSGEFKKMKKTIVKSNDSGRDGGRDRGGRDRGRGRDRDRGRGSDRHSRNRKDRHSSRDVRDHKRGNDRDFKRRDDRDFKRRDNRDSRGGGSKGRSSRDNFNRSNGDGSRFFINIGRLDQLNKRDLADFVSSYSGVDPSTINNITLGDKFSFFNVEKNDAKDFSNHFKGVKIDGRDLRVNEDN